MIGNSFGAIHFSSAIVALVVGAIVLGARKGTAFHRIIGAGYIAAMLFLNASALAVYRLTGHFEPFHALALVSAATILRGILPALRRRQGWLMAHYANMAWSYIALLAAACSEVVLRLSRGAGVLTHPWQVVVSGLAIAVVFVMVGMIMLPQIKRTAMAR
jgi:uncharacterized membrane protein